MITASLPSFLDSDSVRAQLADRADVRFVEWSLDHDLDAAPDAVVLPFHTLSATPNPGYAGVTELERLRRICGVRLVQLLSLGYEGIPERLPAGAVLCNAAGAMEEQTAELASAIVIAMRRDLHGFARASSWANHRTPGLFGARVLLLGHGGVGTRIEQRLRAFGADLVAVVRNPREHYGGMPVRPVSELVQLAASADVLVCSLPLTEETRGLVDANVLAALPDGALVVNVGRGPVLDTAALLAELRTGRISAGLDVVDPEPLPDGHELWALDNVLITPHVGGNTALMARQLARLVAEQLVRLDRGAPLANVVESHA
jgi:phosphoglycerate dehydrogenase-like enzyme